MGKNDGRQVIKRLRQIIEKNEQKLAYFQNRVKQAQFIDRPNPQMLRAAGTQAASCADELDTLYNELRALEQLYGKGVQLRPTEMQQLRRIWYWTNEPTLCRFLRTEPVSLQAYIDSWHRWSADEDTFPLSLELEDKGLIGFVLIRRTGRAWETRHAHVEFIIIRPECRHRGYGTQAVKRAIAFAFEELGVTALRLQVDAENHPALACFERSGLKCVTRERQPDGGESYTMEIEREASEQSESQALEVAHSPLEMDTTSQAVKLFAPLKDLI